jgi:hypothetical protein
MSYDIVEVASKDAEVFVALSQDAAGGGVDLLVGDAGTGDTDGLEVGIEDYLVDGTLTVVELAADGDRAGDV